MPPFQDLTGFEVGWVIVVKRAENYLDKGGKQRVIWECKCKLCGKTFNAYPNHLKNNYYKSCGCYKGRIFPSLNTHKEPWRASFLQYFRRYYKDAESRNIEFNLTEEQCQILFKGNCVYCGIRPYNVINKYLNKNRQPTNKYKAANGSPKIKRDLESADYIANGIDRKDNTLHYFLDNCVSCCKICNMAKTTMPLAEWNAHLDCLAKFHANNLPTEQLEQLTKQLLETLSERKKIESQQEAIRIRPIGMEPTTIHV